MTNQSENTRFHNTVRLRTTFGEVHIPKLVPSNLISAKSSVSKHIYNAVIS